VEVDQLERALRLPVITTFVNISGKHLFKLEPASRPQLKLGSNLTVLRQDFVAAVGIWWLHKLGGQQQHGHLFDAMLVICVRAAVLASAAVLCIDKAGTRFCDLVGRG